MLAQMLASFAHIENLQLFKKFWKFWCWMMLGEVCSRSNFSCNIFRQNVADNDVGFICASFDPTFDQKRSNVRIMTLFERSNIRICKYSRCVIKIFTAIWCNIWCWNDWINDWISTSRARNESCFSKIVSYCSIYFYVPAHHFISGVSTRIRSSCSKQ